ncbi:hypothetical protein RHSIM_Rhsim05G0199800 [Rhododendron simsii]|uniref:Uncharacterized protein n=1 Tax=Rhododendron simsii TaxID=118357 RepID=A0A834LNI0_RHOSS|nr:hypothetical protein RHSIM_Rhsim05G0199800 [Rhododendron simsii]
MGSLLKPSLLVLLLLVINFTEARPLSFLPQQRFSKVFETLGVVCKCCDGPGGECTSTTGINPNCSNLQCLPWKLDISRQ